MKKVFQFRVTATLFILAILSISCDLPFQKEKPPCEESILKIGDISYRIKEIKTKSDGSLKIPSNTPDVAYWVNQTDINHVFALSPTTENLSLQMVNPEQASLTWENCNSSTFVLSTPQASVPDMNSLLDQSFSGITIFIQDGFVIRGEFIGEEIQVFDTPDPSAVQAEISLLETTASADKATIRVTISIVNVGTSTIKVTAADVGLLRENAPASTPTNSEPSLPKEIAPGFTETFTFTYARPDKPTVTLKVFDVEYELEGY